MSKTRSLPKSSSLFGNFPAGAPSGNENRGASSLPASTFATSARSFDARDLDALGGAELGVNLFYQGVLLDPALILNSAAVQEPAGDLTTDSVYEGSANLYFTIERAQDAVGSILTPSANVTITYDDDVPSITADLTDTGVVAGTYGDATNIPQITVDAKGRATAIVNIPVEAGGGGVIRCRLATDAALPANSYANGTAGVGATLTGSSPAVLTVDGATVVLDDPVLVKDEAAPEHNGPYQCTTQGTLLAPYVLTRVEAMDEADEFSAALVAAGPDGAANSDTLWQCTAVDPVTVGTTAITFIEKGDTGAVGPAGPSNRFIISLSDDTISTKFDNTSKRTLGRKYFDPTLADWGTSGTSTATLYMILETTNTLISVQGDLYQQTGTGSPVVIASTPTTSSATAALVSVDVTAAFLPTANPGIFVARAWITTQNGTDQATCSGAWIEVQP